MIYDLKAEGILTGTVEQCLKEYVGSCVQILETSDEIYIGKDFRMKYTHSKIRKA